LTVGALGTGVQLKLMAWLLFPWPSPPGAYRVISGTLAAAT